MVPERKMKGTPGASGARNRERRHAVEPGQTEVREDEIRQLCAQRGAHLVSLRRSGTCTRSPPAQRHMASSASDWESSISRTRSGLPEAA